MDDKRSSPVIVLDVPSHVELRFLDNDENAHTGDTRSEPDQVSPQDRSISELACGNLG